MLLSVVSKKSYDKKETLLVPFAADQKVTARLNDTDKSFLDSYIKDTNFSRKDVALVKVPELGINVLLCGVVSLTDSLASAIRTYADRIESLVFEIEMFAQFSLDPESLVNSITSAVLLGSDQGRSADRNRLRAVSINVPEDDAESYRERFNRSTENLSTTLASRAWGNEIASSLSATELSESLRKKLSKRVKSRALTLKELKTMRLSGIAGLEPYSSEEPNLLVFEHNPEKGKTIVVCASCIVDPTREPSERDRDAIGAATVRALAEQHSTYEKDHHVVFLIALARCDTARAPSMREIRLASGTSFVVSHFEHLKLVLLADALYFASRYKPRLIISLGADGMSAMLGNRIMTYVSNADVLKKPLEQAGRFVHERVWELPLITMLQVQGLRRIVKLRTRGSNAAYSNIVSLDLSSGGFPWMHIDLSSHTTSSRSRALMSEGSTGLGAATMSEYLRRLFSARKD